MAGKLRIFTGLLWLTELRVILEPYFPTCMLTPLVCFGPRRWGGGRTVLNRDVHKTHSPVVVLVSRLTHHWGLKFLLCEVNHFQN